MSIRNGLIGAGLLFAGVYGLIRVRFAAIAGRPGTPLRSIDLSPVTHHVFDTEDGARIHVHEMGNRNGPAIVLLHGVVLQWWLWNAVAARLLADHHIIAWDMRGHGESTIGSNGMTIEAAADDLAAVLETLDITDATLVGYSMGGMVIGRFAIDRPGILGNRIAGLVFVATSAAPAVGTVGIGHAFGKLIDTTEAHKRLDPLKKPGKLPAVVLSLSNFGPDPTAAAVEDLLSLASNMAPGVTADSVRSIAAHDVRHGLGDITVPTLVLAGTFDKLAPPAQSRLLARGIPGARLKILADVGHALVVERPDVIAGEVREFAARVRVKP